MTNCISINCLPFYPAAGRTDVVNASSDFVFTTAIKSSFSNVTIVDDKVMEFDELFIAEFSLGPEISSTWNVIKGVPSIAFIVLRDDDSELNMYSVIKAPIIA